MKLKIFCRCSLFPSSRAKDLSAPLYKKKTKQMTTMTTEKKRKGKAMTMEKKKIAEIT